MKGLLLAALVSAPAASWAAEPPSCVALPVLDSPQKILDQIGAWRSLELSPDPSDPLSAEFGAPLDQLQARAEAIVSDGDLAAVQDDFHAWRLALLQKKYPSRAGAKLDGAFCSFVDKEARKTGVAAGMMRALAEQSLAARVADRSSSAFARAASPFDNAGPRAGWNGADASVVAAPAPYAPGDPGRYDKIRSIVVSEGADPRIVDLAVKEAVKQDADPLLVLAVINAESGFHPGATSYKRDRGGNCLLDANGQRIPLARGLMQLVPEAGRYMGVRDSSRLYDVSTNLRAGVGLLKHLWDQFAAGSMTALQDQDPSSRRDVKAAVAAYNAGPNAIRGGEVPRIAETQGYVKTVLAYYNRLRSQLGA